MARRRLILAIVAAVFCGMAWLLSLDRLSAEERLLVGTWTFEGRWHLGHSLMRFESDRRYASGWFWESRPAEWRGHWFVRGGAIVLDDEPNPVRRGVRTFLRGFGLPYNGAISYGLESVTAEKMVLAMPHGTWETWTRAPAE